MKKVIFKVGYWLAIIVITWVNRLKLFCVWSVGRGLRTEGKIYIPAIKGEVCLGNNCWLGPCVRIGATEHAKIQIGNNVSINQGSFIIARESIVIGDDCRIGEYVSIRDNDHQWKNKDMLIREQGFVTKSVVIGKDVWIGRGAVISKGVKIGNGAVIGANSVVTKDIPDFAVVGVPARIISHRVSKNEKAD